MQDLAGTSQDVVLAAARAGDSAAWEEIDRRFRPLLTRYAARKGVTDPEDLAQEVLYTAYSQIHSLDTDWNRLRAWMFTVAYRRCADHHRRRYRRPETLIDIIPEEADLDGGADEPMWAAEAATEATAALAILGERERDVVSLRIMEELSTDVVARRLGVTAVNVRVTQSRALSKLRSHLENNGGQLDKRFRNLLPVGLVERLARRFRSFRGVEAGKDPSAQGIAETVSTVAPVLGAGGIKVAAAVALLVGTTAATLSAPTPLFGLESGTDSESNALVTAADPRPSALEEGASPTSTMPAPVPAPAESVTTSDGDGASGQQTQDEDRAGDEEPTTTTVTVAPSEVDPEPPAGGETASSGGGEDLVSTTLDATGETVGAVGNLTTSVVESTTDLVGDTTKAVGNAVGTVTNSLDDGLTETVDATTQATGDLVTDVTDSVEDTVTDTAGAVDETASDVLDTVDDLLSGVVGSLFGP